jgi:tripeptidyl-peptidase-2
MSKIVTPDEDGYITGISGRKLMIPSNWINPSGQYHVGVKPVYELYTKGVKERIEVKRKEDNWDKKHRLLMAEANRKLTKEQSNGNKSTDNLTPLEKLDKEDIEAQLEVIYYIVTKDSFLLQQNYIYIYYIHRYCNH